MCHTPLDPIIGAVPPQSNKKETRIINVGLPKSGSTSLHRMFSHAGRKKEKTNLNLHYCGQCIFDQIQEQRQQYEEKSTAKIEYDLLHKCGDFHVWTQIDFLHYEKCIFPQIQYLEELYSDAPNATWLMPMRNVSNWVRSVTHYRNARELAEECDLLPYLNITIGDAKSDDKMMELYCAHIDQIRFFVKSHPTLSYIEFRIEDPNVGSFLKEFFPSLSESRWKNFHHNREIDDE